MSLYIHLFPLCLAMMPTKQRDKIMKDNFWDNAPYWFGFDSELDYYCWLEQLVNDYLKETGYRYWTDEDLDN